MSLFKSVKKKPLHQILIGFLWPQMSFKRLFRYLYLRLLRLHASPSAIAGGLAIGAALSFTPLLGAQIILSIAFSWILRANKVAALLGTLIGTPWTLPFMLFLSYKTGLVGIHFFQKFFPNVLLPASLLDAPLFDFKEIYAHPDSFFLPTLLGSLPLGICVGLFVFFITYLLIKSYRNHRGALK